MVQSMAVSKGSTNALHEKEIAQNVTKVLEENRLHARTELLASEKEYFSRLVIILIHVYGCSYVSINGWSSFMLLYNNRVSYSCRYIWLCSIRLCCVTVSCTL